MTINLKKILYKFGRFSGLPYFFRELIQRNKVTFLLFHDLKPELALKSFAYLQKKYNIISLKSYLDAVLQDEKLPKKAMVITFDDGYIGNYDLLQVVKKLNIPITIFLCASIIGTKRKYWFDFNNMPITNIVELNKKSNTERLKILSKMGFCPEMEYEDASALQPDQIAEMKANIDLQSHAKYHPVFPNCSSEEAWEEIQGAKRILESQYKLPIYSIAYPNGEYSQRDIDFVKKAGYECALTVDYGFNDKNTDLFRLKRMVIRDDHDMHQLIVKSSGAWAFIKTLIRYQPKSGLVASKATG